MKIMLYVELQYLCKQLSKFSYISVIAKHLLSLLCLNKPSAADQNLLYLLLYTSGFLPQSFMAKIMEMKMLRKKCVC
jgi:hypothetical protein